MTAKSDGFDCLLSPIFINPDTSDIPIIVCDGNYKMVYKNSRAYQLGLNRIGSFITNHLSKNEKEGVKHTEFSNQTCLFIPVYQNNSYTLNAFVCKYRYRQGHTVWIFPATPNLLISKLKNKLLEFMPTFAQSIRIQDTCTTKGNYPPMSTGELKNYLTTKSLFSSFNCIVSNSPNNSMTYNNLCMIITRFVNTELLAAGYDINISCQLNNSVLLIKESYSFVCAYIATLVTILDNLSDKTCDINIKIENNHAVIKTCSSSLPSDNSAEFHICKHLSVLFDFNLTVKENPGLPLPCVTVMKVPLVLPGYLCSYTENQEFDVIYNKFMYFFKDI